jgi:hypothetical protein
MDQSRSLLIETKETYIVRGVLGLKLLLAIWVHARLLGKQVDLGLLGVLVVGGSTRSANVVEYT